MEVRREDQDKINRFSRLHQREKVLEEELKTKQVRRPAVFPPAAHMALQTADPGARACRRTRRTSRRCRTSWSSWTRTTRCRACALTPGGQGGVY